MAKLKTVEHKRSKPQSFRRKAINQGQIKARRARSNGSTLQYSKELLNTSVDYLSKNKLLTFLALGVITAGSITYLVLKKNHASSSLINKWLTDRF